MGLKSDSDVLALQIGHARGGDRECGVVGEVDKKSGYRPWFFGVVDGHWNAVQTRGLRNSE